MMFLDFILIINKCVDYPALSQSRLSPSPFRYLILLFSRRSFLPIFFFFARCRSTTFQLRNLFSWPAEIRPQEDQLQSLSL